MDDKKCLRCTGTIIGLTFSVDRVSPLCGACAEIMGRNSTGVPYFQREHDYYSSGYRSGWNDALQTVADLTRRERK